MNLDIRKKKISSIRTFGNSMLPILSDNDIVYLKASPFSHLRVNDIVTFFRGKKMITHRIIYKTKKFIVTKGDYNLLADNKVYPSQIAGRIYQIKRNRKIIDIESIYLLQASIYFREIRKINEVFHDKNINFLFLKGLPLRLFFEKTYPRRLFNDCDILIDKRDFEKVENVLLNNGYTLYSSSELRTEEKRKKRKTELSYYKKFGDFIVQFDIHFEPTIMLFQLNGLNALYKQEYIAQLTTEFLKEKQNIQIDQETFPILKPSHLVTYLALHFFHDNFKGIHKLAFLHTVFKRYKNKEYVLEEIILIADDYNLRNFLYPSFYLMNKYFKGTLSKNFLLALHPNKKTYSFIKKNIYNVDIFSDESIVRGGLQRFINLLYLSPNPLVIKYLVFFHPDVILALSSIMRNSFSNSIKSIHLRISH